MVTYLKGFNSGDGHIMQNIDYFYIAYFKDG
jgi:hypothetical protein